MLCLSVFHHCNEMLEVNNLETKEGYFRSQLWRFLCVTDPIVWVCGKADSTVGAANLVAKM